MPVDQHPLYGVEYVERVPDPARRSPGDLLPGDLILDENGAQITDENDDPLIA